MKNKKLTRHFIKQKMNQYELALAQGEHKKAFSMLEDAHVIGQRSTYFHCLVHYKMLRHGLRYRDFREVFGQVVRLVGAFTKTAIGLVPIGNTGGANVSPFKRLPVSKANQEVLDEIEGVG
ncbi:hypothetical protein GNIT_3608 [Glaciecola nitratireducens FR1064]|uniref:DUF3703 domain-containing protein n=2 Tax=Brumicola TaxID=3160924 RepID=G4QNZ4_GLANF|nr:hypothetical protein GNIT_3608 [Glaciecola nitratireducens FR1064]